MLKPIFSPLGQRGAKRDLKIRKEDMISSRIYAIWPFRTVSADCTVYICKKKYILPDHLSYITNIFLKFKTMLTNLNTCKIKFFYSPSKWNLLCSIWFKFEWATDVSSEIGNCGFRMWKSSKLPDTTTFKVLPKIKISSNDQSND